ncbi:hypothetical protein TeGR_g8883 [Tetraparma gracilis]|uniref:Uncharacterized protein n=1 Tax=Tetraparma gracilis TaxID=2962635 RepID=A0ABQ6MR07_9STRA|nr:hypothetical protein TeGR_g8883 [Tetraparma gracilis]
MGLERLMYTAAGDLNAVFFASSDDQNGMFSTHEWEPVPLPNDAMCMNTCDYDACHWDGHDWHTTRARAGARGL